MGRFYTEGMRLDDLFRRSMYGSDEVFDKRAAVLQALDEMVSAEVDDCRRSWCDTERNTLLHEVGLLRLEMKRRQEVYAREVREARDLLTETLRRLDPLHGCSERARYGQTACEVCRVPGCVGRAAAGSVVR